MKEDHDLPDNPWDLARDCYFWSGEEDEQLYRTHISQVTEGDMFVLEARHPIDPIFGLACCERVYRAVEDAHKYQDTWQVLAERM